MNPHIIARRLKVLYDALDPAAEKAASEHPVSCRKGCSGCCHQLTGLTIPEGFLLAKAALAREDWRQLAEKMRDACQPLLAEKFTREDYFRLGLPCVFLDKTTGTCTVYAERPSACRFHYVISPPENCEPSDKAKPTMALNLVVLETYVWDFNAEVMGNSWDSAAPLQLTVLFCMRLMERDSARRAVLDELVKGLPDPHEWTKRALLGDKVTDLLDNSDEMRAVFQALADRRA